MLSFIIFHGAPATDPTKLCTSLRLTLLPNAYRFACYFSPIYTTPSSGTVLADTKDAESVSADRQWPDRKADRCRVRLATTVPGRKYSNNRRPRLLYAGLWERRPPGGLLPDSENRWLWQWLRLFVPGVAATNDLLTARWPRTVRRRVHSIFPVR